MPKMPNKSKFIVVDHDAKKAGKHQDIRFRKPSGKLWDSFAVRKGVPLKDGPKVLAIKTHDHSEKEALFVGKIEEGYGAGKLVKFDGGTCTIEKYSTAHMAVRFEGSRIKGLYHFVSTKVMKKKGTNIREYFLFKGKVQ